MRFPAEQPIPLWTGSAPLALGSDFEDVPTLTAYYPREWKDTHKAVIVLAGGAYCGRAEHEGPAYARWLADNGYNAFVCDYRVDSAQNGHRYHHPVMISDAARAIRLVRVNAADLGVDPHKIGVMGSSAGGHLAASCATFHEMGLREAGESAEKDLGRPDFSILCYPVISLGSLGHAGSTTHLLGEQPDPALVELLSMEKSADAHTPSAFLFHTWADNCVPVQNALLYAIRLREVGVPCDVHIYERGCHGIGLAGGHPWTEECLRWLAQI